MLKDIKDISLFDAVSANIKEVNEDKTNEFTELIKGFEKRHYEMQQLFNEQNNTVSQLR
jgi:hypothetical protein